MADIKQCFLSINQFSLSRADIKQVSKSFHCIITFAFTSLSLSLFLFLEISYMENLDQIECVNAVFDESILTKYVRAKYLQYDANYVKTVTDVKELEQIIKWYTPSSQPRNIYEWDYIHIVRDEAIKRLDYLTNVKRRNCNK